MRRHPQINLNSSSVQFFGEYYCASLSRIAVMRENRNDLNVGRYCFSERWHVACAARYPHSKFGRLVDAQAIFDAFSDC